MPTCRTLGKSANMINELLLLSFLTLSTAAISGPPLSPSLIGPPTYPPSSFPDIPLPTPPASPSAAPTYAPSTPPPTYPPVSLPLPPSPYDSSSSPSPSPVASPPAPAPIAVSGFAVFVGHAATCIGTITAIDGTKRLGTVSTDGYGHITGAVTGFTAQTSATPLLITLASGPNAPCTDDFTGLPLPFAASTLWLPPNVAASTSSDASSAADVIIVTPTTRLLSYSRALKPSATAAYELLGLNATGAELGALSALKQSNMTTRLNGIRMVLADATLSSLAVIINAALSPYVTTSTTSTSMCATAEQRVDALYSALAVHANSSNGYLNLTNPGLCEKMLAATATICDGGAPSGAVAAAAFKIASQACGLYGKAAAALQWDAAAAAEMPVLPLMALALAARVSYVVQAKGAAAVAALGSSPQELQQLVAWWSAELSAAPIRLSAITDALILPRLEAPSALALSLRATGALVNCPVSYQQLTDPTTYLNATTDAKGSARWSAVSTGWVIAPAGCRDFALSNSNKTSTAPISLRALLPPGTTNAIIDMTTTLASSIFLSNITNTPPRDISLTHYANVYGYFGVGLAGSKDAVPQGADFLRQNWPYSSPLVMRSYLLNLRLTAAIGPASAFISGLLKTPTFTVEKVAAQLIDAMSRDLLAKILKPDDKSYLTGLMRQFINKQQVQANLRITSNSAGSTSSASSGRLRRRTQSEATIDETKLNELLTTIATVVSESSSMLVQLDRQVVSAAESGSPLDTASTILSAAKIAAVQQSSLTPLLAQMGDAAASGNTSRLNDLTNTLTNDFTGSALQRQVQAAQVDTSDIPIGSDGVMYDNKKKTLNVAAVVGGVVGGVVGIAILVALVTMLVIQRRKRHQVQQVHVQIPPRQEQQQPHGAVGLSTAGVKDVESGITPAQGNPAINAPRSNAAVAVAEQLERQQQNLPGVVYDMVQAYADVEVASAWTDVPLRSSAVVTLFPSSSYPAQE